MDPQIAIPFPNIDPAIFTIGPFDIGSWSVGPFALRWYALAHIAVLVWGWWYMARLVATPRARGAFPAPGTHSRTFPPPETISTTSWCGSPWG